MDVLVIAETKLDGTFPTSQLYIPGFKHPYRLDLFGNSGELLVYINEQIPSKQLERVNMPDDIQVLPIELNLKKIKWLLLTIYKPPCQICIL